MAGECDECVIAESLRRQLRAAERLCGELREALMGANWIICRLAPHEALAMAVRGYIPDAENVATAQRYRAMIDKVLATDAAQQAGKRRERGQKVNA